jgi:hypothetical protein
MSIQKKSLISTLKTAKKAKVAGAPISEREPKAQQQASPTHRLQMKSFKSVKGLRAKSFKSFKGAR